MVVNILSKSALSRWSVGFIVAIILIYTLIPIFEYQVGIAEPKSVARIILATALAISSIGSIATGVIGVRRKRTIFFVPLVIGLFGSIGSAGFGFNIG